MRAEAVADAPVAPERAALVAVDGLVLEAFPAGVLWWADERLLVVADLHLEKGSAWDLGESDGAFVPPGEPPGLRAGLDAGLCVGLGSRNDTRCLQDP